MIGVTEAVEWLEYDAPESDPDRVSGAVVFKNTRLPVEAVVAGIRAVFAFGAARERQLQSRGYCSTKMYLNLAFLVCQGWHLP
jgi:hypothetical protein